MFFIGIATAFASSDICVNSSEATVQECIWSNEVAQGISIAPKQIVFVNPFISFPPPPSLIPFSHADHRSVSTSSKNDVIYALIEADLNPEENMNEAVFEVNNIMTSSHCSLLDMLIYLTLFFHTL